MKISGSGSAAPVGAGAGVRRAADGFAPSAGSTVSAGATGRAASAGGVSSLDALLALQETGGPLERRRRAIRRAGRVLDGLDGLKLALIDGRVSGSTLDRLRGAGTERRELTDDAGLEALLDQVDLRAAVELAKLEPRRVAA